tara:strand:- start:160 stop:1020 length:861 start_codon:yes stop_codon:yes gene_type:complete
MLQTRISRLILLLIGAGLAVVGPVEAGELTSYCESNVGSPNDLKELKHGLLQGYLAPETLPDSLKLLTPPPAPGSAAQALDEDIARANFALEATARWTQASKDADLNFPAAASIFSCSLGIEISEERTPRLYTLLRRSLTDAGLASYKAKNHYQRSRPFMGNGQAICTPDDEAILRTDGSYPSGHTSVGWAWALILSEIAPNQQDQILERGLEYGRSRNICNVHWHSDVQAGQLIGAATVSRLHTNEVFRADLRAAAEEIHAQTSLGKTRNSDDCEREKVALGNNP